MRHALFAVAVAVVLFVGSSTAKAGEYGLAYGFYPYYYRSAVVADKIPYFAANPPVYYSYYVPRPYGWSPFAYPIGPLPEVAPAPAPPEAPKVEPSAHTESLHQARLTFGNRR